LACGGLPGRHLLCSMSVEDGLIRTHGGMGLLWWTGGKIGNSVIRVVYKMCDHNDNSDVFIRIPIEPREARPAAAGRFHRPAEPQQ